MRLPRYITRIPALSLVIALLGGTALLATTTARMNLAELATRSGRIFVGKCLSVTEATVPGPGGGQLPYTEYTFSVTKAIKGSIGATISVRQLGAQRPDFVRGRNRTIVGMPQYKIGEEYVLLLTKESRLGLTVPVGMAQGSFKTYFDAQTGQKKVVNGLNNAGLFNKMEPGKSSLATSLEGHEVRLLSNKQGALAFGSFVSLLQKLAR